MKKCEVPEQVFFKLTDMAGKVNSLALCREFGETVLTVVDRYPITKPVADRLVSIVNSIADNFSVSHEDDKSEIETAIMLIRERILNAAGFTDLKRIMSSVVFIETVVHNLNPARVRQLLDPIFNPHGIGTLRKVRG